MSLNTEINNKIVEKYINEHNLTFEHAIRRNDDKGTTFYCQKNGMKYILRKDDNGSLLIWDERRWVSPNEWR